VAGTVDVGAWGIVGVHREYGGIAELGENHAAQVPVDFANRIVGARRHDAVAIRRRGRTTDKVIPFIHCEDKKRIAFVDPVRCEPREERIESLIVSLELLGIARFAWAVGEVDIARSAVPIVGIGDIGIGDGHSRFLHLRNVGQ